MTFRNWLLALCVTLGTNAFAASVVGFTPTENYSVAAPTPADAPAALPQGDYVSEDGDLTMRISKSGIVKADFAIMLTNGTKAPLEFPRKLRFNKDEEVYSTNGDTILSWWTNVGMLTCRYPVRLEIRDLGEGAKIRARFEIPANMSLDAYGRCFSYGTTTKSIKFERE